MGRLVESARYRSGSRISGGASEDMSGLVDSRVIDEGFNRVVSFLIESGRREREEEARIREAMARSQEERRKLGLPYTLRGSLFTDERPIQLETTIYAHDDSEAKRKAQEEADKNRDLENYGVSLFIYRENGKQVGSVFADPKKDKPR